MKTGAAKNRKSALKKFNSIEDGDEEEMMLFSGFSGWYQEGFENPDNSVLENIRDEEEETKLENIAEKSNDSYDDDESEEDAPLIPRKTIRMKAVAAFLESVALLGPKSHDDSCCI